MSREDLGGVGERKEGELTNRQGMAFSKNY